MSEEFISEPIEPVAGTFNTTAMTRGEPALPERFKWRDKEYAVLDVLEAWKETGPCRSGSSEKYLRKQWYKIRTDSGPEMTLYFERQPRSKTRNKTRWWLYTINTKEKK
jgi:phosphoribosylglycinamide formyltransferase-1